MKKFIIAAALSAGLVASLHASSADDLILGFRATGGTGAGTNLELDLGSISNYVNATSGSTLDLGSLLSSSSLGAAGTIDSVYGADWATRSDLTWGLVATQGSVTASGPDGEVAKTIWMSSGANSSALDGTASGAVINGKASSFMGNALAKIATIYPAFPGSAQAVDATSAGSWTVAEGTGPNVWSGIFARSTFENNTNIAGNNGSYVASDLYQVSPVLNQPGTYLGTFAITNAGEVTFSAAAGAAIPEPTTYAAFIGAGALGFSMLRRRKVVAA